MDQSPTHTQTVYEAVRLPAIEARREMLLGGSLIHIFGTPRPAPGEPSGEPIVSIPIREDVGVVSDIVENSVRRVYLEFYTPLEERVTSVTTSEGVEPKWARIETASNEWWADVSVSVEGGDGELQMVQTGIEEGQPVARLFNGAFARISSFVIEG